MKHFRALVLFLAGSAFGFAATPAKTLRGALQPFAKARPEKFRDIKAITGPNPDDR